MRVLRTATALLLALHALVHVELRFFGTSGALGPLLVAVAAALGLLGAGPARERPQRDRAGTYRVGSLWSLHALVTAAAFLLSASTEAELARATIGVLVLVELLLLAWPSIGPRGVPLLVNSLSLCALSALAGGPLAVSAVGGFAPLAALFVVADHHEQRRAPPTWALPAMAGHAAFAAALTWPLLALLPSARAGGRGAGAASAAVPSWEDLASAWGALAFWGLVGFALSWLVRRLLRELRGDDDEAELSEVEPAAEAGAPVPLSGAVFDEGLDLSGPRGRIVREFERLLAAAARLGRPRRASATAAEHARGLPAPASRLARLFGRARYSIDELSEQDAASAAADAATVLKRLRDV